MNPLSFLWSLIDIVSGFVNSLYGIIMTPFVTVPFVGELSVWIMLFNPVTFSAIFLLVVRKKLI